MKYVDPAVRYPSDWTDEFIPGTATLESTWHAMESLVDQGLAKSIGISNYNAASIMDLLNYAKIKPAVLQIEHHPYLTQEALIKFVQSSDIQITAYSSFGPSSFIELDLPRAKGVTPLFDQSIIQTIAKKYRKTTGQVLLRWAIQRGLAVIPKSTNEGRLVQNLDVFSFDLEQSEIAQISKLDKGLRFNDPLDVSDTAYLWVSLWLTKTKDNVPLPIFA
jgi:D-xylose reductase